MFRRVTRQEADSRTMSLLKAHGDKDQPRYSYDVCIVVSSLEIGGAERAAINLAKALTDSGMSVHLIVLGAHGPLSSLVDNRVATTYLESMSARRSIRPLRAELRRNPARSCIGEDLHIGLLVAYATAGLQTKAFVHDHSDPIQRARSTPTGIRSALWLGLKMAALIGQIERYVACSEGAARSARLYFGLRKHQVSYVFNPVVASVDDATLDGHCGSTFDVVVVCRLVAGKRVDWILHAVNQLDRPIRVCIIGDGPNRPHPEGQPIAARLDCAGTEDFLQH